MTTVSLRTLPLGYRHEDQGWSGGGPFLGRQCPVFLMPWGDRRLVIRLVDKLPVEHASPPTGLGVEVPAIEHHCVPPQGHDLTLTHSQPIRGHPVRDYTAAVAMHTFFVADFDARISQIAERGL